MKIIMLGAPGAGKGTQAQMIADKYNIGVEDLMDWNDLESDVIVPGQKLTLVEPKKDKKTTDKKPKTKVKTHTVKEGENLTLISEKYGVTLKQLKDWNDMDNDVIVPGQVLNVSAPGKETKKKEKVETPKTYKVKKGDTLQTIADEFGITIKELKKWNELDDDTIMIGQILKVTAPTKKKK